MSSQLVEDFVCPCWLGLAGQEPIKNFDLGVTMSAAPELGELNNRRKESRSVL